MPSALAEAGKFVLENWSPLASAGQALVGRRRRDNLGGMALPAIGLGLGLTAGVAKLGLSLLQRRLQPRDGGRVGRGNRDEKRDPLRGLNAKSKTLKKSKGGSGSAHSSRAPASPPARPTPTPLQQLSMLFPSLDRSLLGDMLASNQGSLEQTIDQLLSLNIESSTPTPAAKTCEKFQFPPTRVEHSLHSSSSSPLPACPECPVCFTSLAGKRIFQCASGHHVCQECKKNPQLKVCPTCRQKLVGRATNMEQFLATIYGNK